MLKLLLHLERLQFKRSPVRDRLALERGMVILFKLLLLIYALIMGLGLNTFLTVLYKDVEPTAAFFKILTYYFFIEFIMRYFLEGTPKVEADKYLHLPIPKKTIVQFLLLKSFFSFINLFVILLFLPFILEVVSQVLGNVSAILVALNLVLLSWTVHWLSVLVKTLENSFYYVMLGMIIISIVGGLDYFDFGVLTTWMGQFLEGMLPTSLACLVLILIFLFSYFMVSSRYARFLNADAHQNSLFNITDNSLSFLSKYGLTGQIADVEWKLILRHKKSKNMLKASFFGLLYGFYLYGTRLDDIGDLDTFSLLFPAIFSTGIFILNFGQFFLSWNTSHFDFYLNQPGGVSSLIQGKMMIFLFSILIMTILSTPYLYFGGIFLAATIAVGLFNAGINMHFITLLTIRDPLPMDINNGSVFNYEGVGCAQFIMGIPFFVVPLLLFALLKYWLGLWGGIIGLSLIGIIGLMLFPVLANLTISKALNNKYTIGENFRNKKY